jgi:RNA polymerase sigma-70 factor (ECF subfamily)
MFPQPAGINQEAGGDDAALVRRIVAGERELYGVLVERYQRRLWWSCRRMLGDPDEAEDVVQETLVRAYQHLTDYDPTRRFYTWLYAIARNRCLNVIRRRNVWGFQRLGPPAEEGASDAAPEPAASSDAASLVESREIAAALAACLETLPEEQRACFELRHGEDFSYAEIASVLGIPPGTVMSRLARAREKMRACLEGKGVGGTT